MRKEERPGSVQLSWLRLSVLLSGAPPMADGGEWKRMLCPGKCFKGLGYCIKEGQARDPRQCLKHCATRLENDALSLQNCLWHETSSAEYMGNKSNWLPQRLRKGFLLNLPILLVSVRGHFYSAR